MFIDLPKHLFNFIISYIQKNFTNDNTCYLSFEAKKNVKVNILVIEKY